MRVPFAAIAIVTVTVAGFFQNTAEMERTLKGLIMSAMSGMQGVVMKDDEASETSQNDTRWFPSPEWLESCADELTPLSIEQGPFQNPWKEMAIGDCIKFCSCYPNKHPAEAFNKMYFTRCSATNSTFQRHEENFEIVEEVHRLQELAEPDRFVAPDNDVLVIHLRLGDIMEDAKANVSELLIQGGNPGYRPNGGFKNAIKSVHEILENIYESEASKVYIVGGSHKVNMFEKSRVYAGCIHRAVQAAGFNENDAQMRLEGTHPEEDFYFVSHAKQLVVSAGGFSNLMGRYAVNRGGKIVGRSFGLSWAK